ncbi:MAG TPA: hypothetical protein VJ083_03340 [Sedimentibacter sp.]|nr:hypothetical protein [Sedimentibacter sp.]
MKLLTILCITTMAFTVQQSSNLHSILGTIEDGNKQKLPDIQYKKDSTKIISEFKASKIINENYTSGKMFIFGNYQDFDINYLKSITKLTENIYIFYDLYLNDNLNIKHQIMTNNVSIYHHINGMPRVDSYKSNSKDINVLLKDINKFVNDKISFTNKKNIEIKDTNQNSSILRSTDNQWTFTYSGSVRDEKKPYGYIDYDYVVKKYRVNDITSLYILETNFSYTPGQIARMLGNLEYDNWINKSGFAKVEPIRAWHDVGSIHVRQGGTPVYKDAYPVNGPGQITITSTYQEGLKIGHSFKNGFSLDGITIENSLDIGRNISQSYSKSYTNVEPALNTQKDPNDAKKYTWLYSYRIPRNETNHLNTGYIFEMNNKNHDMFEGDIAFTYDYQMEVCKVNVHDEITYTHTFDGRNVFDWY